MKARTIFHRTWPPLSGEIEAERILRPSLELEARAQRILKQVTQRQRGSRYIFNKRWRR